MLRLGVKKSECLRATSSTYEEWSGVEGVLTGLMMSEALFVFSIHCTLTGWNSSE